MAALPTPTSNTGKAGEMLGTRKKQRFAGKAVIVTGSNSGIGRETALAFALEGASVLIHGQNVERLADTERALCEANGGARERVAKVAGSLEDPATAEKIIAEAIAKFGGIDVLVNNAGAGAMPGCTDPTSLKLLDYIYAVNLRSVIQLTQLAWPHLVRARGSVVNVSSVVAQRPFPMSYYSTLKGALDAYTKSIAQALGPRGVRVNTISPGVVDTPIFNLCYPHLSKAELEKLKTEVFAGACSLGRVGEPAEIASAILFLADTTEAGFITGATLVADGGYAIQTPTQMEI